MRKKQFFNTGIIALILTASLLVLKDSGATQNESPICCKKAIQQCSGGVGTGIPANKAVENMDPGFSSLIFNISS